MTTAQYITLKTDINAKLNTVINSALMSIHLANSDFQKIADYYNEATANDLWRPDVTATEITKSVVNSAFTGLTALKQQGLMMYLIAGTTDATTQNVRDGFSNIFGNGATLTALTAVSKRKGTNFEMLFVGAVQSGAYVSSAYGITVTGDDIVKAIRS